MKYQRHGRLMPENPDKYNRVEWLKTRFDKYEDYYRPERARIVRNQRMMWGINFGQWPSYVVEKLNVQGRRPPTFNVIGKKIEQLVSSYTNNGFDIRYAPVSGEIDSLSMRLQDMYFSDKNYMQWDIPGRVALRDMHNIVGYETMIVSDRHNEFGNISWEAKNPSHIYLDIGWRDPDPNNIKHYFEWGYFTAWEICDMFPNVAERIRDAKAREEREGLDLGMYHGGIPYYQDTEQKWGDRHQVIIFHSIEKDERYWEYDLKNRCSFPETGFKPNSDEDRAAKKQYIEIMGLNPEYDIVWRKQKNRVKYLEAICPALDAEEFLASGKDKIQTNNCNIYPLGDSYNGQFKGTTDDLYDIQLSINKGEMVIDDIQVRSAKGAFILDEALAAGDESKRDKIEQMWNDPGARIWVDEGSTHDLGPHGGIIPLPSSPVTGDHFNQVQRRYDLTDWFSVPAAMDARGQGTQESGKLFQSKVQVGLMSQKYGMELYKSHEMAKAMAYAKQAKITYAGFPRTFHLPGSKEPVVVNQRRERIMLNGTIVRETLDDISMLPEMLVTAIPSKKGINLRTELRDEFVEILQYVQDPADRLVKLVASEGLMETYDMDDERKEELKKAYQILKENAALQQAMANMQMKMQMQQMGQPQMPAPGGGGGPDQAPPQQAMVGEPSKEVGYEGTPQEADFLKI